MSNCLQQMFALFAELERTSDCNLASLERYLMLHLADKSLGLKDNGTADGVDHFRLKSWFTILK